MEGPSLVIAIEEFAPFKGSRVTMATGTAKLPFTSLKDQKFLGARSWGKHFLLTFEKFRRHTKTIAKSESKMTR